MPSSPPDPKVERANCIANENSTSSTEIGEHDDRQDQLAQPPARACLRGHGGNHRRREAHGDDHEQEEHRDLRLAGGVGRDRQPWPGDPGSEPQPEHGDRERGGSQPANRTKLTAETIDVQRQPGDEGDQGRRDAGDHLELCRHRFGDDVAKVGTHQHAKQQVPGEAGETHAPGRVADDPRTKQREAKRQRRSCRSDRVRRTSPTNPQHRGDGERQRREPSQAPSSGSLPPASN